MDGLWDHRAVDPETGDEVLAPFPFDDEHRSYVPVALARKVVLNDASAWLSVAKGKAAALCRQRHIHGRMGVDAVHWSPPCRTWTCPKCAVQHVLRHLVCIYGHFVGIKQVRLIWVPRPLDDAELRALGRTRSWTDPRKKAWYVCLTLTGGRGVLIAVLGDPGGALARSKSCLTTAVAAFGAIRNELRLPDRLLLAQGNYAPSYRRGSGVAKGPSAIHTYAAGLNARQSAVFERESNRLALDRYGEPFELLHPSEMDEVGFEAAILAWTQQ